MDFLWGVLYFIVGMLGVSCAALIVVFLVITVKFIQEFWRGN